MLSSDAVMLEHDVEVTSLAELVLKSGRTILEFAEDHFWVQGNRFTSIQVGHVVNKQAVCFFAGRPLPVELTEPERPLIANRMNAEFDVIRFYSRFSEVAKRNVLFVSHYAFYADALVIAHFFNSLQFVEYFALELDIEPYTRTRPGWVT